MIGYSLSSLGSLHTLYLRRVRANVCGLDLLFEDIALPCPGKNVVRRDLHLITCREQGHQLPAVKTSLESGHKVTSQARELPHPGGV